MTSPKTLVEAVRIFANADNCREYLVARRWPDGVTCPTCGSKGVYFDRTLNGWKCKTKHPRQKFTLKTGTIFEDSPIGFDKWLPVVWMITNCKNGVSSWEIHRAIGVTQKTAWFMLQRVRLAMQDEDGGKLGGEVEADETYIGAKARNMHKSKQRRLGIQQGRSLNGKVAVMGLLERHGDKGHSRMKTKVLTSLRRWEVQGTVRDHVEPGSTMNTDAYSSYVGLDRDYVHNVIDHAECYVDGTVHTNGCENYWSLLKRAIKGTYVSIEPFHLFRYLDEQAFRFNNRSWNDAERFDAVVKSVVGRRLTYEQLIGAPSAANAPA
jgi:transposase-like protein